MSGIIACAVRIATACEAPPQSFEGGRLVWLFACLCGTGFALASVHSSRIKTGWFAGAPAKTRVPTPRRVLLAGSARQVILHRPLRMVQVLENGIFVVDFEHDCAGAP